MEPLAGSSVTAARSTETGEGAVTVTAEPVVLASKRPRLTGGASPWMPPPDMHDPVTRVAG